ncbi:MAG TPA: winged helix DNA-binding domain-containing protein [Thermoplasmata archaeon]|nr:winged helix DNA-binding domain-containing protein [Thermoplasmata archaeon]
MAAAQLALRVRVRNLTLDDIERALWEERTLARVWCMRGTVHLVPSDELAVFARGSSTRQLARVAAWMARSGAPPGSDVRLMEAACASMDRPRTRNEIAAHVRDALGVPIEKKGSRGWGSPSDASGFRVGRLVFTVPDLAFMASYRVLACFGPDNGQGSTFVRPDAWLPSFRDMPAEDAEDAFLRRYLGGFGPATVHDFAMWSILTVGRARQIWSRLANELEPVAVGGQAMWILRRDLPALKRARLGRPTVRLLPYFDSFLMGHKGRDHLVDAAHYKRIYRAAGWVYPAVLVDGRIAGEWSYERQGKRLRVRVTPYVPLEAAVRDRAQREAEDVARFLEAPEARVAFAKVR